jgi:ribosomal protein L40E
VKICKSCQSSLLDVASFCHNCGREVQGNAIICLKCNTPNPAEAKFCFNCGHPINLQYQPKPNISPYFKLDFNDIATLPTQLKDAFLLFISILLEKENQAELEASVLKAFDQSGFRLEVFEEESVHIATLFEQLFKHKGTKAFPEIEKICTTAFLDFSELLWIKYCPQLLSFSLSKDVLAYQKREAQSINLAQMIRDYLQMEEEAVMYYLNAVEIPPKKMKNARKSFFKHDSGEYPYLFIDQTIFGSAKEGVVLTQKGLYWKVHFHKAQYIPYKKIKDLQLFSKHLEINKQYFNISNSFNYKFFKLLYRIKSWNF